MSRVNNNIKQIKYILVGIIFLVNRVINKKIRKYLLCISLEDRSVSKALFLQAFGPELNLQSLCGESQAW